jgi:hypothetical protein
MRMSPLHTSTGRIASGVNGLLGAGIMITPLVFGFAARGESFVWVSLAVGATIMTLGMARLVSPGELPFLSWTNFILGACILLSPWMFRFDSNRARMWTNVVAGGIVMLLAAVSARITLLMRQRLFGGRSAPGLS